MQNKKLKSKDLVNKAWDTVLKVLPHNPITKFVS